MGEIRFVALAFAILMVAAFAIVMPAQAHDDDGDDERRFTANLSGDEEVPPRDTRAHGKAQVRVSEDGSELRFKVTVRRISNVVAAHIHCGAPGVNGPVGVTLFGPVAPGGGRFSGVLAKGVKTAPDSANACGWADLAQVISAIESGLTYVNVHTNDGVAPPNTGPGDFPGGEIRGHLVAPLDDDAEFNARLAGANEVPARDTNARGQAQIRVSEDGTTLVYKITVRDISNVVAAHIHCGAPGVNGPVGVTLFGGAAAGGGPFSGLLAKAMRAAPDSSNACGWVTLADVIAAMESGDTYVNVHTNDGVAPPNTGPGDFPGGEIRGQLVGEDDDDDEDDDD